MFDIQRPGVRCMSAEFVDANVLIYAHDGEAGAKHGEAVDLLERLFEENAGGLLA